MSTCKLIDRLRNGPAALALWHQSASELMVELAALSGFETLVIDNEHGPASISETLRLVRTAQGAGAQVIVRVNSHCRNEISRTLDTSVDGLIVPMVNSGAEARAVVEACRYAPVGSRGVAAAVVRASGYGTNAGYIEAANRSVLLAVQIESREAVDNIDEIICVPGIDMFFIGPSDLASSMGYIGQLSAPPVVSKIEEARVKILSAGKLAGTVPRPDANAEQLIRQGYHLVVDGSDIGLYRGALQAKLANNHKTLASMASQEA